MTTTSPTTSDELALRLRQYVTDHPDVHAAPLLDAADRLDVYADIISSLEEANATQRAALLRIVEITRTPIPRNRKGRRR